MLIPYQSSDKTVDASPSNVLHRRQQAESQWSNAQGGIIAAVVIVSLLCLGLLSWYVLRRLRAKYSNPRYVPTQYLKQKWQAWMPSNLRKKYSRTLQDRRSIQEARRSPSPADTLNRLRANLPGSRSATANNTNRNSTVQNGNNTSEVDRRTSVRSVMTLPSYSADARPSEQIIGREGDRDGMDTVIEFPETNDQEESRREEEMESLYQIRVARRTERSEREERRRVRREARTRGDQDTLNRLRDEQRDRTNANVQAQSATLINEHNNRDRGRKISEVSYWQVGSARHDGSRLRADSHDSGRPLLDSPASMGSGGNAASGRPGTSAASVRTHHHNQSTSSLRFAADVSDDGESDVENMPTPQGSRRPSISRTVTRSDSLSMPSSSLHRISTDIGDQRIPDIEPPQYEEQAQAWKRLTSIRGPAPAYTSGVPEHLPEIEVTPFSPAMEDVDLESGPTPQENEDRNRS